MVCDDEVPEERFVEAMRVLERVDDRESRLGAKKHGGVAVGDVQIDEKRALRVELRECRRDVDRHRRRADAALGANEGVGLARHRRDRLQGHQAIDRRLEILFCDVGHDFRDAHAHRFEEQRGIEPLRDDDHAGRRMLALQQRQRRRQVRLVLEIQDEHVGLLRARLGQRRELGARHGRRLHAARGERELQLPIGRTNEENIRGHVLLPNARPIACRTS